MYNEIEDELVILDIAEAMRILCSVQYDIDEGKLKAAQKLAIDIDLMRHISEADVARCIDLDESNEADVALYKLLYAPLVHFTNAQCLTYFQGTLTDSGYSIEEKAVTTSEAKNNASRASELASIYMVKVVDFLKEENPATEATVESKVATTRLVGGRESRNTD